MCGPVVFLVPRTLSTILKLCTVDTSNEWGAASSLKTNCLNIWDKYVPHYDFLGVKNLRNIFKPLLSSCCPFKHVFAPLGMSRIVQIYIVVCEVHNLLYSNDIQG